MTSKLSVGGRIDEHVDCTVAVCKPHYCELHSGRRLERTVEGLDQNHGDVRRPEREVRDARKYEDLECTTAAVIAVGVVNSGSNC